MGRTFSKRDQKTSLQSEAFVRVLMSVMLKKSRLRFKGRRVKSSYYTAERLQDRVVMSKFDEYFEHKADYELVPSGEEWLCSCPARIMKCRHVKMQAIFVDTLTGDDPLYNDMKSQFPDETLFLKYRNERLYSWVPQSLVEEIYANNKD